MLKSFVRHFLKLSLTCALMAFSAHAAEDPPPPDNSSDNNPAPQEGEECESDEDCPDGYICTMDTGVYPDDAPSDSDDSDVPEEDPGSGSGSDDGDSSGGSSGSSGTSVGICVLDPSCDSNDDCMADEFCEIFMYLECTENEDGTRTCSSAQEGWCSYDYRDDCTSDNQCSFPELCYQRPIDDHAHCTEGYDVPCSADADCGDRLVCQDTFIDQRCFWNENGPPNCETLREDRCGPRSCTNSEVCLADEICMIMPHRGPPGGGPILVEAENEGEGEEQDSHEDVDSDETNGDAAEPGHGMPEEEGMCAPYEEASECENSEDCGTYEECAVMTNLPCFEGDTRCEEASVNVCAHLRIECEEDVDCPDEHHCSFHYVVMDPFDPYGGIPPTDAGEVEPSTEGDEGPSDDDDGEDSSDDEGHGGGEVHPPGEDDGQGPPPMDVGLCFPEFEDMLICDENGCMMYVDHSWIFEGDEGPISEPVDDDDDDQGGSGTDNGGGDNGTNVDGDNTTGDGSADGTNNADEEDQNLDATSADGPQPLFNCQSSGPEGYLSLLGLLFCLRMRRRD